MKEAGIEQIGAPLRITPTSFIHFATCPQMVRRGKSYMQAICIHLSQVDQTNSGPIGEQEP